MRFRRVATLGLFAATCAWSQSPPAALTPGGSRPALRIPKVSRPPRLADFVNGVPRENEVRVDDFRQREPGDGVPATQPTSAYLSYDSQNLYVAFVCKDDPAGIRARLAQREDIGNDDQVAVYLDTFHDHRRAYLLAANPLGVQADAVLTEGQEEDFRWDTVWRSEGQLEHDGYAVLFSIPFKSLRFASVPVQEWGLALGRVIYRNGEHSFWPYISNRYQGFAPQMATLQGLENISPGRNVQLMPYGTLTRARFLDSAAPSLTDTSRGRAGMDAKVVLRDALALDIAANPDFSEVESDEPRVTVNQRYEVFFPEKRPFFLENAGFFQTPVNLFFSRRIVDPRFGARLTGKAGGWTLGVLGASDREPEFPSGSIPTGAANAPVPDSGDPGAVALGGRDVSIGVLRVQRELGEQSSIGMFMSSRGFGSAWNRVYALDAQLKLSPNWLFTGQFIRSDTRERDGRRFGGPASYAGLYYSGRHLNYVSRFQDRSANFRADLGFIQRVDIRQAEQFVSYLWRPDGGRLISFGPSVSVLADGDHKGRLQDWFGSAQFEVNFVGPTQVKVSRNNAYELYEGYGFRRNNTELSLYTERLKWIGVAGALGWGTAVNYVPAAGIAPFLANSRTAAFALTLRPTPRLRLEEMYLYDGLTARRTDAGSRRQSIFHNHLARSKFNYQFTRALSLRLILDYGGVLPNPGLVDLERDKRVTGDVLFSWLVHPGTALYIGYTSRFENLALDPLNAVGLRRTGSPTIPTGRQFFIKLSYVFRL